MSGLPVIVAVYTPPDPDAVGDEDELDCEKLADVEITADKRLRLVLPTGHVLYEAALEQWAAQQLAFGAEPPPVSLRGDELKFLASSPRCQVCGHLLALHNYHCCTFCTVPGCRCEWDKLEGPGAEEVPWPVSEQYSG